MKRCHHIVLPTIPTYPLHVPINRYILVIYRPSALTFMFGWSYAYYQEVSFEQSTQSIKYYTKPTPYILSLCIPCLLHTTFYHQVNLTFYIALQMFCLTRHTSCKIAYAQRNVSPLYILQPASLAQRTS